MEVTPRLKLGRSLHINYPDKMLLTSIVNTSRFKPFAETLKFIRFFCITPLGIGVSHPMIQLVLVMRVWWFFGCSPYSSPNNGIYTQNINKILLERVTHQTHFFFGFSLCMV